MAEFKASLLYTEHRFYGLSLPSEQFDVDILRFLTVEQALADLANFITQIERQPRYASSPVLLVGFGATMAALFRQLYPHYDYWSVGFECIGPGELGLLRTGGKQGDNIRSDCEKMFVNATAASTDIYEFARYMRYLTFTPPLSDCRENYVGTIWFYQTCSEFGWYQTSRSPNQPFGTSSPVEFYIQKFWDVFGASWNNVTIHERID